MAVCGRSVPVLLSIKTIPNLAQPILHQVKRQTMSSKLRDHLGQGHGYIGSIGRGPSAVAVDLNLVSYTISEAMSSWH